MGAESICGLGLGDERHGQLDTYNRWTVTAFTNALHLFDIKGVDLNVIKSITNDIAWDPRNIRLTPYKSNKIFGLTCNLRKLHNRNILPCVLKARKNLQHESSG